MEKVKNDTPIPSCAIIGGCGFLGHEIVRLLIASHPACKITVCDLRLSEERYTDVDYIATDITKREQLDDMLSRVKPEVVIHTASPVHGMGKEVYMKVNVEGTKNIVEASAAAGVKALVYTSSAGVVFDGTDLINADEKCLVPVVALDAYNESKALAEEVALKANGKNGMLTTALRPAGIFGPGDKQAIPGFLNVLKNNQTMWQLGDNHNLFDWTFITNVAHAHLLAASVLLAQYPTGPSPETMDPMSRVDGAPFFVTNGEPTYFWDFPRTLWALKGHVRNWHITMSREVGLVVALLAEVWAGIVRKEPGFTRFRVKFSCVHRYFSIGKARTLLGYEPLVGLVEGMKKTIEWVNEEERQEAEKKAQ